MLTHEQAINTNYQNAGINAGFIYSMINLINIGRPLFNIHFSKWI